MNRDPARYLVALMTLVLIVDRASAATGDRSNCGPGSATSDGANGRATGCPDADSLDGSANLMPSVIPVINHIGNYRVMS